MTIVITPTILHSSNERHVYEFGNEFGAVGYVLAESFEDAYAEMLWEEANNGNICDHGGDITDEQRANGGLCDCSATEDGRWVWDVYLWLKPMRLSVDHFYLAFPEEL